MVRRISARGNKKTSLVSFHLNVIESRNVDVYEYTLCLLKTVSNLSKLQSSNDSSFIVRIVPLFDVTKEGTIPRSILVRYSPDDVRLR